MAFGFIGAVSDGLTDRLRLVLSGQMINTIGTGSKLDPKVFRHNFDKTAVAMLYLSCMSFVACFLEGYCWTRTSERQASRMRAKYMKAVLRQDLGYFDIQHASGASEVITSISNDTLVIQEAISDKVPNFVSNVSGFIGGYMVAFILVWQLAMVALPLVLLLVVPGWLCGRSLIDLAGKIRREYITRLAVLQSRQYLPLERFMPLVERKRL
ncbi:hypothetical protein TIFTF001_026532 [Ficus carica]|uniref:ABC transmembrane type-1 domain-containing protein n=1 Tax=Ficus carica TaxID=3494 RepID=A0AA88IYU2_FICCA|nr:hypothetical protein TIFTF001_026532 [Ficus carica]